MISQQLLRLLPTVKRHAPRGYLTKTVIIQHLAISMNVSKDGCVCTSVCWPLQWTWKFSKVKLTFASGQRCFHKSGVPGKLWLEIDGRMFGKGLKPRWLWGWRCPESKSKKKKKKLDNSFDCTWDPLGLTIFLFRITLLPQCWIGLCETPGVWPKDSLPREFCIMPRTI